MAVEAGEAGRGGITMVARATGAARSTVTRGVDELDSGATDSGRVRRAGAGRKRAETVDAELAAALDDLVEPESRGDRCFRCGGRQVDPTAGRAAEPGRGLRWSHVTVGGRCMRRLPPAGPRQGERGRPAPRPRRPVPPHRPPGPRPSGGGPARHLVDTKKKESSGSTTRRHGSGSRPETRTAQDVTTSPTPRWARPSLRRLRPRRRRGFVAVGVDRDTAEFAVATIRRWWEAVGAAATPTPTLLITADAGGSNGYRNRLGRPISRARRRHRAGDHRVPLPARHLQVEQDRHRLFCPISSNWRGETLTSHQVVVDLIANTTTRTGLKVHARLDQPTSTPPASRSPTSRFANWKHAPSPATTGTANGTTERRDKPAGSVS